jgi:ubiquinone/menaquinone biosynthesis C-methylase UbiE
MTHSFDTKYQTMQAGHADAAEWDLCYREPVRLWERFLKPGMRVVDAGCGPSLPYRKNGAWVIGIDPSVPTLFSNADVDEPIFASASAIPLPDQSIDAVVCFYSIHHMTGNTWAETRQEVLGAFREFRRILRPGGRLAVVEMIPSRTFQLAQRLGWTLARKMIGPSLDMCFWDEAFFWEAMPGLWMERTVFPSSPWTWIRPVLSWPWLKIPRLLHPLTPMLFTWTMPIQGRRTISDSNLAHPD